MMSTIPDSTQRGSTENTAASEASGNDATSNAPRPNEDSQKSVESQQEPIEQSNEHGSESGPDAVKLGARLRTLRKAAGVSLRELARRLKISPSAVSQIERGQMLPSVNRLFAVTAALGVPLAEAFVGGESPTVAQDPEAPAMPQHYALARAGQIESVTLSTGVVFRSLAPIPNANIQFFESVYTAGASGDAHGELNSHHGFEIGQVVEGELTIVFEDERVVMREGDSITYPCSLPHLLKNESGSDTRAIWLVVDDSAAG